MTYEKTKNVPTTEQLQKKTIECQICFRLDNMDESEWLYILDLTSLSVLPLRCGVDTSYATHIYIMIKSDGTDLFRHLSIRFLRGLVNTATSGDRVSECCNKHHKRFQTSYFLSTDFLVHLKR